MPKIHMLLKEKLYRNSVNTGDLVKSRLLRTPSCGDRDRAVAIDHVTPRIICASAPTHSSAKEIKHVKKIKQ